MYDLHRENRSHCPPRQPLAHLSPDSDGQQPNLTPTDVGTNNWLDQAQDQSGNFPGDYPNNDDVAFDDANNALVTNGDAYLELEQAFTLNDFTCLQSLTCDLMSSDDQNAEMSLVADNQNMDWSPVLEATALIPREKLRAGDYTSPDPFYGNSFGQYIDTTYPRQTPVDDERSPALHEHGLTATSHSASLGWPQNDFASGPSSPWSSMNTRQDQTCSEFISPEMTKIGQDSYKASFRAIDLNGWPNDDTVLETNEATSLMDFNLDVNLVMGTSDTRHNSQQSQHMQHPLGPSEQGLTDPPSTSPLGMTALDQSQDQGTVLIGHVQSPGFLVVPPPMPPSKEPTLVNSPLSVRSYVWSNTSSTPTTVSCDKCGVHFTGLHRKGNCARHKRLRHGATEKVYPCQHPGCDRSFQRSDARLKHHRKHHPELASKPAEKRPRQRHA